MLVLPTTHNRLHPSVRFSDSAAAQFKFDAEVMHDELGLRLVRIGEKSPLRVLTASESMLVGVAEVGDSIVAINGVSAREALVMFERWGDLDSYEIAIFDHRTRRTVLWNLNATNPTPCASVGHI